MTAAAESAGPLVFLVAGEPSGDQLGARLMAALKKETGGRVRFAGVGGDLMAAEGLRSLFSISELAVMGFVDVLPRLAQIYRRVQETVAAARAARPDVLVTIDSPNFTLEVSKRLKGLGFARIHYVAPSVWAWKPWRAKKIARDLDHLLALLTFEPPYFEEHGLPTTVVGHPAVEATALGADAEAFRWRHAIPPEAPVICVLPGSRRGEIRHHEPTFAATLGLLKRVHPDLHAVVPTVSTVRDMVLEAASRWPVPAVVVEGAEKQDAFAASRAAVATSGTVSVELAVAGVPAVIGYRVGSVNAVLGWLLLNRAVKYASLVNIILRQEVQPEYLQRACTPDALAQTLTSLLADSWSRRWQLEGYREAVRRLGGGAEPPSTKAARVVLSLVPAGAAAGLRGGATAPA